MRLLRHALGLACLVTLAMTRSAGAAAPTAPPADLVVDGAKIYTVDPSHSTVEALAVRGGKIVFVGSTQAAQTWIGPTTKVEHLGGRLVLPGLFDSHIHPIGIIPLEVCDLDSATKTLRELAAFVQKCVTRYKVPAGGWLSVHQWNFSDGNQPDALRHARRQDDHL